MPGYHFISYSRIDGDEAGSLLFDRLRASGFAAWMDRVNIRPGDQWDEEIAKAIGACESFLFVMTRDSVTAECKCRVEIARAQMYKKPLIPLRFHGDAITPLLIQTTHHVDFTGDFEASFNQLSEYVTWHASPAGTLHDKESLLKDTLRELSRESDPSHQARIRKDIEDLENDISNLRLIVDDPTGTARRVQQSIDRGLEQERLPKPPPHELARTRFINPPPAAAPDYFQDRHLENKLIASFLKDDSKRLMTVVGRGGVGKTAVVCQLLKALESGELPDDLGSLQVDGVVYLSGSGLRRITAANLFADLSKLLSEQTADELDRLYKNPQASATVKMEALLAAFPRGRVVLLLDNFEDALDSDTSRVRDSELAEALRALLDLPQHAVKVILTTRIAPVDLAFVQPGRQSRLHLDEGLPSPFAENILREMDSDGKVGLQSAAGELLDEARKRTLGFPRALEALYAILAADRHTSLREILDNTERILPEQVVEALVGEAFNRLDQVSQALMQALAIYSSPVTAVAVDYLLQPYVPGINSVALLNRLVNMQLVRKEVGRYYLHTVDRAYAIDRIPRGQKSDRADSGPPAFTQYALWNRGADFFTKARSPKETWKTREDLIPQLTEFDLRCEAEDYETAADVLLSIDFDYLYAWGYYRQMAELHRHLVDKVREPYRQQASLGNLGTACRVIGWVDEAITYYQRALEIVRAQGNRTDEGIWLGNLANCYQDLGQTERALECNQQAFAIAHETANWKGQAINLSSIGNCYADLGKPAIAIDHHNRALALLRLLKERHLEGLVISNLADALIDEGRYEDAIAHATEGARLGKELANPMISVCIGEDLVLAYLYSSDLRSARTWAEANREYDVPGNNEACLAMLGVVALRQGEQEYARRAFEKAVEEAAKTIAYSPRYFQSHDASGIAHAGLALCQDRIHVRLAIESFNQARNANNDAGIVGRVVKLVDALAGPDDAGMLGDIRNAASGS